MWKNHYTIPIHKNIHWQTTEFNKKVAHACLRDGAVTKLPEVYGRQLIQVSAYAR